MRIRSLATVAAAGLVLFGGVTACGDSTTSSTPSSTVASDVAGTPEYQEKRTAALAQFPDTPPKTVVAASVPIAEVLDLLGVPVAGVPTTMGQHLPASLDGAERIGTVKALDVEKIVKLSPDLVVASEGARSSVEASLASTKTPAAYLETENFDDLRFAVDVLATAFDREDRGAEVLSTMDRHADTLTSARGSSDAPKVLLLIGAADSFMVMSGNSFLGSLVSKAGADNIAESALNAKETFSAVNLEKIVAAAPDVVLVLQSGDVAAAQKTFDAEVEKNPAWKSLPAYQNKRINVVDYNTFGYTSVTALDTSVPELTGLLYP